MNRATGSYPVDEGSSPSCLTHSLRFRVRPKEGCCALNAVIEVRVLAPGPRRAPPRHASVFDNSRDIHCGGSGVSLARPGPGSSARFSRVAKRQGTRLLTGRAMVRFHPLEPRLLVHGGVLPRSEAGRVARLRRHLANPSFARISRSVSTPSRFSSFRPVRLTAQDARPSTSRCAFDSRTGHHHASVAQRKER